MFHFFENNSSLELEAGKFSTSKMHSRNQPEIWGPTISTFNFGPHLPAKKERAFAYLFVRMRRRFYCWYFELFISTIYVGGASSSLLEVYLVCAHYESNIQCPAQPLAFSKKDDWKLDPIHIVFLLFKVIVRLTKSETKQIKHATNLMLVKCSDTNKETIRRF